MKLKLVVSLLAVLSLFGASTYAQDTPKVDIFVPHTCSDLAFPFVTSVA
jgi:hypothetical protein